jgi:pyruvate dehydrogenase E1 component
VNRYYVAQAAVAAEGKLTAKDAAKAIELYGIDGAKPNPVGA